MDKELIKDMDLDNLSIFWLKLENSECYNNIIAYTVEIPAREQSTQK